MSRGDIIFVTMAVGMILLLAIITEVPFWDAHHRFPNGTGELWNWWLGLTQ